MIDAPLEPPDKLLDPIGYHVWFELHKCRLCRGTGIEPPESCAELERRELAWLTDEDLREHCPCPHCDGEGVI